MTAALTAAAVQLPPTATLAEVPALAKTVEQALAGSGSEPVRLDASALQSFDTATLALLMQARRLALASGRNFSVVGAPPKLAQLADLYGVEELLALSEPAATA